MTPHESAPPRGRKPTMRDVARLAGVSPSTVSFVVNDRAEMRIADGTRVRVQEAIETLGFRPDLNARALRRGQTHTIGMISDEIASSPFAGQLVLGVQDRAWEEGRMLLMTNTRGDKDFEQAAVDSLVDRRVDGLLFATQSARRIDLPTNRPAVPTVLVNCYADPAVRLPAVLPREVQGGCVATQAALHEGHRRLVYLAGNRAAWATRMRERGFRRALRAAGVPSDGQSVVYSEYDAHAGYDGAQALMKRRRPPTVVICANDRAALGALFGLRDVGIDVPGEVSIVGYDDQEDLADATHPGLTTVRLPHYEMGAESMTLLFDTLAGNPSFGRRYVEPRLIRRGSLGPPPERALRSRGKC